jgi:hypothetical protein
MTRRPGKKSVPVEHAELGESRWHKHRERQKLKAKFLQREAARGRPDRGFSREAAEAAISKPIKAVVAGRASGRLGPLKLN